MATAASSRTGRRCAAVSFRLHIEQIARAPLYGELPTTVVGFCNPNSRKGHPPTRSRRPFQNLSRVKPGDLEDRQFPRTDVFWQALKGPWDSCALRVDGLELEPRNIALTLEEAAQVMRYAEQLCDERALAGAAMVILNRLLYRYGGRATGRTSVDLSELAGDAMSRTTLLKYLDQLELAHLVDKERTGIVVGGRWQQRANIYHLRTAGAAKALALEAAMRQAAVERATAREAPPSESNFWTATQVQKDSNTYPVLTAQEAQAKWLPSLPPLTHPMPRREIAGFDWPAIDHGIATCPDQTALKEML